MCRISIKRSCEESRMKHGGVINHVERSGDLFLTHDWLPIQTSPGINDSPIINSNGAKILFNGEIFGHFFNDDLELIHFLYDTNRLYKYLSEEADGFWSFIVEKDGFVTALTDPLGKKQLYYKEGFGIASEIRDLLTENEELDPLFAAHTIKFGYVTDDSTPYKNIKRIIPNKKYKFNRNLKLLDISKENMVDISPKRLTKEEFLDKMKQSVTNRLCGKKKVSILLSGGLDSSIIYHHLKEVDTYCIENLDDSKYAKIMDPKVKVLSSVKTDHNEALKAMEMPLDLGSMDMQHGIMNIIPETVILTGDGADEIFGGYDRMKYYDSQYSDVFEELPYYHNIRLDRMASWFTKEIRSPFMHLDIVRHGLSLSYEERMDKQWLRETYTGILPTTIVHRSKVPLKSKTVRENNPVLYRTRLVKDWNESLTTSNK